MRGVTLVFVLILSTSVAEAQEEGRLAPTVCHLPVSAYAVSPTDARAARPAAPDCDPATEGTRFEVTYDGFPFAAEQAFQAAVDTWACNVRSDQVVRVDAAWVSLGATTLGSAGPFLYRNFPAAPTRDVWYPAALADALSGRDLGDGAADIDASFNRDFDDWHFGPGPAMDGDYDLYTVVLHELGHGLGFIGSLEVENNRGYVGREPEGPFSYDLHTQTPSGLSLLDASRFPDGSLALGNALQEEVRFVGRAVEQALGMSVPLYTPRPWVQGGSYSHLDEDTFGARTPDGLMTPFIARNETIDQPGPAVCAILADVGWTLAGQCEALVGGLAPTVAQVTATVQGPNPFSRSTTIRIESLEPASVRASLVDVLGRRVADYGMRVLVSGTAIDLAIDATTLASGTYFLTVRGGPEAVVVPLSVVR